MSLVVNNLSVDHGAIRAISGVSFTVESGKIAAVIGSNGAGKTTLLRTLSGLKSASHGSAHWNDHDLFSVKPEFNVRHGIAHVGEGKSVIAELSVEENLHLGAIWRKNKKEMKFFDIRTQRKYLISVTIIVL
jgi:branched-chain amino acid transport system ATP-binding protein